MNIRTTKEEALAFLLTFLVVEKQYSFTLDPLTLFQLTNLSAEAANLLASEEGLIPHEVIEQMGETFLESQL